MKIKTTKAIVNFKGIAIKDNDEDFTVGKAISNILLNSKSGGKMKIFILAKKFYDEKEVEVDAADLNLIKSEIEKADPQVSNMLVTGQLLIMLDGLKEKAK